MTSMNAYPGGEPVSKNADLVFRLFQILDEFGAIERKVKTSSGTYESNSHHSMSLALVAYEFACQFAPELDADKVLRYALVHDLPEIITGDMQTLTATPEELAAKRKRDEEAVGILAVRMNFAPHIVSSLLEYERCDSDEAKFVYWFDKIITIPTHFFDGGDNLREIGISEQEDIQRWFLRTREKMIANAPNPHRSVVDLLHEMYQKMHDELL